MTEPEYENVDADSLSTEQIIAAMWEAGDLSFLMHPSQLECRNKIHAWRLLDQTNDVDKVAGSMPRVFCVAKSGRWGGTTLVLWLYFELACWFVRTYGKPMRLRFTSAWQKSIDEIVGAVAPQCFDTAPPGCVPQYWGKRGTRPAGLYFPEYGPAGGTSIALAGLDVNPNATRGQASDGDVVSEAAFVDKLDYTLRSVLYRQYQGRPWARAIVESSAPKDLDTDWERIYVPDCKRRGAFFAATIEDNTRLTRAEKDEFISAAGGRGNANCEREYFNVISGDPQMVVFPEFDESKHVRDMPIPEHAVGVTADDPGLSHLNGLSLAHYDFDAATIVFRASWAGVNAGSMKLAAAVAAREFLLWGTWPHTKMSRIPLESTRDQIGWRDLLARDEFAHMAEELYEMAQVPEEQRPDFENFPGKWIRNDLPGHSTYWDGREHKKNPGARVSDVDLGLIRDIDDHYGLEFTATNKSELHTMVNLVRSYLAQGRMVFLPGSGPIIDHMRACKWNKQRTKFDSHPVWGHYDVAASAVYLTRLIDQRFQNLRPHPPAGLSQLQGQAGNSVVDRLPWSEKQPHELELERRLAQAGIRPQGGRMKSWR
jgi:hypothetical protein